MKSISKLIALFFGKLRFFKGQDRIVRLFYHPNKFKNLNKGENFVTDYYGLKYKGITSNYIDWGVYFKGGHEKGLVNYLKKNISKFDIFFDVGANSGTISLPFLFQKNLKIICFEPLNYNYKKLIENFKINVAPQRHELNKIAISNKIGAAKIYFSKTNENPGFASIDNYFNLKGLQVENVKLNSLDNMYKFKNKKIFLKIDVEGYEKKVIEGAKNILKNNQVLIYMETRDENALNDLLATGYKLEYFLFRGENIIFKKNKKSQDIILRNF